MQHCRNGNYNIIAAKNQDLCTKISLGTIMSHFCSYLARELRHVYCEHKNLVGNRVCLFKIRFGKSFLVIFTVLRHFYVLLRVTSLSDGD